jgi:hypothetical protein
VDAGTDVHATPVGYFSWRKKFLRNKRL